MFIPDYEIKYGEPDPAKMCGDGTIEAFERVPASPYLRALYVKFVHGAYTKWHYHTGEQMLLATKGKGFVEFQGLPTLEIREGDRVFIPTGLWHRHGADEGETLVHLAVTTGETIWVDILPTAKAGGFPLSRVRFPPSFETGLHRSIGGCSYILIQRRYFP